MLILDIGNYVTDNLSTGVKRKVHKVMTTLHEWLGDSYDLGLRVKVCGLGLLLNSSSINI